MCEHPLVKFAVGAVLGFVASMAISVGLIPLVGAAVAVIVFGLAWRSHAALSGGLCAWGLTWLVLGGTTYASCVGRAPDCIPSEATFPFLVVAGLIFLAGLGVGLIGIVRLRASTAANTP